MIQYRIISIHYNFIMKIIKSELSKTAQTKSIKNQYDKWQIMVIFVRSLCFYVTLYIVTLTMGVLSIPIVIFTNKKTSALISIVWCSILLTLLRVICGLDYKIIGEIPKQAAVIASKHQSAFETFILYKHLRCPAFILKKKLTYIPLFGMYLKKLQMIVVNSGSNNVRNIANAAQKSIENRQSVVIFPEGTRTNPQQKISYKRGIAHIAKNTVIPVALNTGLFWGRNSFLKYPGCAIIELLSSIKIEEDRKEDFMKTLEETIENASKALLSNNFTSHSIE